MVFLFMCKDSLDWTSCLRHKGLQRLLGTVESPLKMLSSEWGLISYTQVIIDSETWVRYQDVYLARKHVSMAILYSYVCLLPPTVC